MGLSPHVVTNGTWWQDETVMDVGWGELLLLAVVALFIFGPEKLPKAAADAGRLVRRLREMATKAQGEIKEHGIDVEGIKNDLRGVADLHPKRILGSAMSGVTDPKTGKLDLTGLTTSAPDPNAPGTPGVDSTDTPSNPPSLSVTRRLDPDAT